MRQMVAYQLLSGVDTFLNLVSVILVVYALMSWFMRPDNRVYIFFARMADVILTPFRPAARWLYTKGFRVDMSVILALLAIRVLRSLLVNLVYGLVF